MRAKNRLAKSLTKGHEECEVEPRLDYRSSPNTQQGHRDNKQDERRSSCPPKII
jgi:hypothetical protein